MSISMRSFDSITGSAGSSSRLGSMWQNGSAAVHAMYANAGAAAVAFVKPAFTATKRPPQRLEERLT
jgi:hypothetical protein